MPRRGPRGASSRRVSAVSKVGERKAVYHREHGGTHPHVSGDKSKIPASQGRDVGHPAIGKTRQNQSPLETKAKFPRLKGETWGTRRSGRHVKIKVPWRQKQNSHVSRARRGAPGAREDTSKSKSPGDKSKIPTSQGRDVGHPAIGKTKAKLKSALKTKSKIPTSQRRDVGHPKYIGPSLRSG